MITVKEAIEILKGSVLCTDGAIDMGKDCDNIIELITHLQSENTLLKSQLSEYRKHTTGSRIIEKLLSRVKELESQLEAKCGCKKKLSERFVEFSNRESLRERGVPTSGIHSIYNWLKEQEDTYGPSTLD